MSVFDQTFDQSSGCFGICNGKEDGNVEIVAPQNRMEPDLKTSEDRQKMKEIDGMLSQALSGLTFDERQEQLEILHGVRQQVAEQDDFIEASLQQLETQLEKIKSRSIYELAEQMDPTYVKARAFRVMFLRGNRYDIQMTAEKMLKFFEFKSQLFGEGKLVKDITLEDLDEGDIAALRTGFVQLAGKDRAGRIIWLNFPGLRGNMMSLQNELRMRYYILMSTLEKEENQLCHSIPIVFSVGDMKDPFGGSGFFENAKLSTVIPNYMAALHLCTDEVREYLIQETILKAAPKKLRSRSRLHFGSQTECLYQMSTYGISRDILPLDPATGQISLRRHLQWVESRFALEKHGRPLPKIITPSIEPNENDVLVGTGKRSSNAGNQRLRAMVKDLSQAYVNAGKEDRRALVDRVINSIRESGGRFLKEESVGDWSVVWNEIAKDKIRKVVAQAFRNSYRRRNTNDA